MKNNVRFICLNLQIWPIDIDSMVFFCRKTGILHQQFENGGLPLKSNDKPTICLHLKFEISSSQNIFMNLIFELDFLSISNWIFAGYTGSKNQV